MNFILQMIYTKKTKTHPVYIHQFQLFRLMQKGTVSTLLILRLAKMEKV